MKILGVIPSRFGSTRFPGKSLAGIDKKTMIRRVFERAQLSESLDYVVVATDDQRIVNEVEGFGGNVLMTSKDHQSGTDRCEEIVNLLEERGSSYDVIVNIQGDEPYIDPEQINLVSNCFKNKEVQIATLAKKIERKEELFNTNVNKVILDNSGKALYFSRHPIPFIQNEEKDNWIGKYGFLKHIGIYAYRRRVLKQITSLKRSSLEMAESLEQLRWIQNGFEIHVEVTTLDSIAVDIPEDLSKFSNIS